MTRAVSLVGAARGLALGALLPAVAGAQTPDAPGTATCAQVVQTALNASQAVGAARAGVPLAQAQLDAATAWETPELRVRDNLAAPGQEPRVGLRVPLPRWGVGDALRGAATAGVALSRAELTLLEAQVALTARLQVAAVRAARRDAALAARGAEIAQTAAADSARAESAGVANGVAETLNRLDTLTARAEADAAVVHLAAAEATLARYAGGLSVDAASPCVGPLPDAATPHTERAHAIAGVAQAERDEAERDLWPWPTFIELAWQRDETGGERTDRALAEVGVALSWPGGAPARAARAEAAQVTAQGEAEAQAAERALADARAALDAARAHLARLNSQAPELERAAALADAAERAGAPGSELRALRRKVLDYERARAAAMYAVEVAEAEVVAGGG